MKKNLLFFLLILFFAGNVAALDKNNGERLCYRPANDKFVEFDENDIILVILSLYFYHD